MKGNQSHRQILGVSFSSCFSLCFLHDCSWKPSHYLINISYKRLCIPQFPNCAWFPPSITKLPSSWHSETEIKESSRNRIHRQRGTTGEIPFANFHLMIGDGDRCQAPAVHERFCTDERQTFGQSNGFHLFATTPGCSFSQKRRPAVSGASEQGYSYLWLWAWLTDSHVRSYACCRVFDALSPLQTFGIPPHCGHIGVLVWLLPHVWRSENVRKCSSELGICGRFPRCFLHTSVLWPHVHKHVWINYALLRSCELSQTT